MESFFCRFLRSFFSNTDFLRSLLAGALTFGFLFACQSSPDPWFPVGGISGVIGSAGVSGLGGAGFGAPSAVTGGTLTVSGSGGSVTVAGSGANAGSVAVAGSGGIIGTIDSGVSDRSDGGAVFGGSGGTEIVTSGSGGAVTPPTVCTANATETEACGECPEITRTRQCLADGSDWGVWSECECPPVLPSECDGQTQTPTWDSGVGGIIQGSCGGGFGCHSSETSSYSSFTSWRSRSPSFDTRYTQDSRFPHQLAPNDLAVYNCWVALGLPQN